ncbi:MAG: sporulation integral membrane protein YlbJ [Defluviitaleaceae bacterium]|nr:sporulation integral membrane protein YlbJ [Defluviitaleaceae bacterium]
MNKFIGIIIPAIVGVFNILIILFPTDMIAAARDGLWLWFNTVVPSLLPFIILTNILSAGGALAFISRAMEPVMRPLFGVPGVGGFAFTAGIVSGYPVGAKIIAQLRADGSVTRVEAQRLLAFCNNSGPLFMLGAVGVSMFGSAKTGYFILATHYISAVITGLLFKYYGGSKDKNRICESDAVSRMRKQPSERTLGAILGGSVKNAIETILLVGGFIILFSVIVKILEITQIIGVIGSLLGGILGINTQTANGLLTGLIEVTNGARVISADSFSRQQIAVVCGIIAFGGFCIHAQALSFIAHTDIKASIYILAKTVQAIIAATTASLLFPLVVFTREAYVPAFLTMESSFWEKLAFSVTGVAAIGVLVMGFAGTAAWFGIRGRRLK